MPKLTPEQFQEKHARRLKGSLSDISAGIDRVTVAPGKKAAAKVDKMRSRLIASIDDGTWAARVGAVSLEDWKAKFKDKGLGRISAGIDGAKDKVIDFASQLLPHIEKGQAKIEGMADLTLEDSINRMNTMVRHMAEFKKK